MEEQQMEWNNIYIKGNPGFKGEVSRKMESSDLNYMPGYMGSASCEDDHDMYWIEKHIDLSTIKRAIGAKLIWKYRLRFFNSLEELNASHSNDQSTTLLTQEEQDLIDEMRKAS